MSAETLNTISLEKRVNDLNQRILEGKILDAFEKFYAENVTMQENENEATEGKAACRVNEITFVEGITEFRNAEIKSVLISDNLSVTEWFFDFSHKDWGNRTYTQLSVQRWNEDGQIVNEKFYYTR